MRRHALVLTLLSFAALGLPAAGQSPAWAVGDVWTYDVEGAKVGSLRVTVAEGGLRTREVEATHAPGAGGNLSEEHVLRSYASPLRLASESRVTRHCATTEGLLPVVRCGNLTQRWAYTPAIEFLHGPLQNGATWSQVLSVEYVREDELGLLGAQEVREERRYFRVVGDAALETVPAGEFRCWSLLIDTEEADSDGVAEVACFAPSANHFAKRTWLHAGQETLVWKLRSYTVQGPGQPPPPPSGTAAAPGGGNATLAPQGGSSSGGTGSAGSAGGSGGGAGSPSGASPSPPPTATGPATGTGTGPAPGPVRDLRSPGPEAALLVLLVAGLAWRSRRR